MRNLFYRNARSVVGIRTSHATRIAWTLRCSAGLIGLAALSSVLGCSTEKSAVADAAPVDTGDSSIADAAESDSGDAGAREVGPQDVATGDGGQALDATEDAGETDAMLPTDAAAANGVIDVDPTDILSLPTSGSQDSFTLRNLGTGDLRVSEFNLFGPGRDPNHPSVDDFSLSGCVSFPCAINLTLCPTDTPGCPSEAQFTVSYLNNDQSTLDLTEIHIASDDPRNPLHILVLSGMDTPCPIPIPVISVVTANPTAGVPVELDGSSSVSGTSATIVSYTWMFQFTPGTPPSIGPAGAVQPSFTPFESGTYVVALEVTNSCGNTSATPASEAIIVSN